MTSELKTSLPKEEDEVGRRVDLHTSSGATICLSFPENETPLPQVIKLVDPDTGQSMVFQSKDDVYDEVSEELDKILSKLDQHCVHSNCQNEANGAHDLQRHNSGDERLEKQREKLQKKLRERKGSSNKEEEKCTGHCNQLIEIPVQGLSQLRDKQQDEENSGIEDGNLSIEEEQLKATGLKIQKAPEVDVVDSATINISWSDQTSNNSQLLGCKFELQMAMNNTSYRNIYSGMNTEHKEKQLKPGTTYRFRLCAIKDKVKGNYSPEAIAQTPSAAPAAPSAPHLVNNTKTSFHIKWSAPNDHGSPVKAFKLQWDKGEGKGKYYDVYSGSQKQFKLSHKLHPGTKCSFRVQAINDIGASEYSQDLNTYTSAGVPDAPKAPHLERAGHNYLTLSWNKPEINGAEIIEYLLEMEDKNTSCDDVIAIFSDDDITDRQAYGFMVAYRGNEQHNKIEKLKRNTTYKFRVAAINNQGSSKWSEVAIFTTVPERPGRPSAPVPLGKPKISSFTVNWDPPEDTGGTVISQYILEMDDGKGGSFQEVHSGLDREQSMNGLLPGHSYRLRVACVSDGGTSEWSRISKVRTSPVCPGQAHPPMLSKIHKPQPNALHLYWDPPDYNGGAPITTYLLSMEVEKMGSKEFREIYRGVDNLCTISGLQPGRAYSFCLRAANEAGVGKVSIVSELSTAPGSPDPPKAPETVCRSAAAIQITWEAPVENGTPVTGYTLEMMEEDTFIELYTGTEKTFELRKGVSPASYYYFRVKALSSAGCSLWSPVSTCHTPPASPAAVSSVRKIDQSSSHLRLRWRHPGNNGARITSYNIEIAGVRNISYDLQLEDEDEEKNEESQIQEYDIVDLQPNTAYRIRVQAVNKIGCGPFSPLIVAATRDLPPVAPALELASASYQSLKLRWGSSGGKDSVGVNYTLEMLDQSGNFQVVFSGATTSHKVGRLQERTEYQFRIQASNEAGTGPYSEVSCFQTSVQPPLPVKGLKAESISPESFTISWDAVHNIRKSDTIEYLLQSQVVGKDQDFVMAYKGPRTSMTINNSDTGKEYRFRICSIRYLHGEPVDNTLDSIPGIKGVFSPIITIKTQSPRKKHTSKSKSQGESEDSDVDIKESKKLTDNDWAVVFFIGFTVLAIAFAFIVQMFIE